MRHAQAQDEDWPYPLCGRADFERNDVLTVNIFVDEFDNARSYYWSTHGDNPTFFQIGFCWECASILNLSPVVKPYI